MVRTSSGCRRFVPYYRVSSLCHGRIGLTLKGQRWYVRSYLASLGSVDYALAKERIESKSSRSMKRRPELQAALQECRSTGATLLIARLSRLRRDATFLFNLCGSGVRFIACDMPEADRELVWLMALAAEKERKKNSARTKEAMAAAKARGRHFGNPPGETCLTMKQRRQGNSEALKTIRARARNFALQLQGTLDQLAAQGVTSASGIARALNEKCVLTIRGHQWSAVQVKRVRKAYSS